MNTPDEQWWSIRAAEYVLGTLNGEDHKLFLKMLEHDTHLQYEVMQWEKRLSGLNETTQPLEPHLRVWNNILDAIQQDDKINNLHDIGTVNGEFHHDSTPLSSKSNYPNPTHIRELQESNDQSDFWKAIAGISAVGSLVLGYLLFQSETDLNNQTFETDGVAVVLSDEDGTPYFLVETDYANTQVRVTPLNPPALPSTEIFQLWQAVPDGSAVEAVTVLPTETGISSIYNVTTLIEDSDLFDVSIETNGASTVEGPLGPVVAHGDFLQTRQAD